MPGRRVRLSRISALAATLLVTSASVDAGDAAGPGAALIAARTTQAAQFLIGAQEKDGHFRYEYDFLVGKYRNFDNIVRQAAAGFVLAEYLATSPPPSAMEAVQRAIAYYVRQSIAWRDGLVVTSDPKASAGATALALLAELGYVRATGDPRFAYARQQWLSGLASLQVASGGFAQSPGNSEESPYFNGEAWLALAEFQRLFPDDRTAADVLARAEPYLIGRHARAPETGFTHWGLMAASVRFRSTAAPRYLDFIEQMASAFIGELKPSVDPDSNSCTTIEGLAAATLALRLGKRSGPLFDRLTARMNDELAKNLELQIQANVKRLPLGGERYIEDPAIGSFAGMFLNGRTTARGRIDFTQHCLSAMLQYARVAATPGK